jgi:outer membrane receptor protein involved in Fe transport
MKGINTFLVLLFAISGGIITAQRIDVKGKVIDFQTKDAIPYASVAILNADDKQPVNGAVTSGEGEFTFQNIKSGKYTIQVSFMGYQPKIITDVQLNKDMKIADMGKILLSPANIQIKEVDVKASAKTVSSKIDRKVYRVSDFETAKGGTATDVLNKLPSVSVSSDGEISVRGTNDFMVYLNGKPTQIDPSMILGQINSDIIDNIEVITVPTAIYDAQGKGGIINISTKRKGVQGLSVSANGLLGGATWGNFTDPVSGFKQNDNRYGVGFNTLYLKDNFSLYGGVNFNRKNVNGMRSGDARLLQGDGSYYHMVASGERPEWYETLSANTGLDYKLSNNSVLSAGYYYGDRNAGRSAFYVYNNFLGDINKGSKSGEEYVYNPNTDNRYGIFNTANIDYDIKINERDELKLSFLYEHSDLSRNLDNRDYDFDKNSQNFGTIQEHYLQHDETLLDGYRFAVDYSKMFNDESKLNIGLQPHWVGLAGGFGYDTINIESRKWAPYNDLVNKVDLTRGVYAGYADYSRKSGKLSYVVGLRLEYTDQTLKVDNDRYADIIPDIASPDPDRTYNVNQLDYFPTVHLKYELNGNNSVTAAASRRINRPAVKNMSPFLYRRHYEVYIIGDPALKPEYIENVELSYDTKIDGQNINLTAFYRGTDNVVFRVNTTWIDQEFNENVLIRSYTNSGNTQSLGAELNTNFDLGNKLKFYLGGSLYNYRVKANVFGYKEDNSSTNWTLKGNANFFVTSALKLSADFNMKSATVTSQGNNELFYMANAAIGYSPKLLKGWSFQLRGLDLLTSNISGLNTRAYDINEQQIFYQETEYVRTGPIVEFGVSYSFNTNGKSGKKVDSTFGKKEF